MKLAEHPRDVAKLARLADVKGSKTRAIIKLFGRGAIVLTSALFNLASWIFWALFNLLAFCAAGKRAVERMTSAIASGGGCAAAPEKRLAMAAAAA